MARTPTGTIRHDEAGATLVLVREFNHPRDRVWAALTESEQSAHWIASWTGEPGVGNVIQVSMTAEEGDEVSPGTITTCTPPRHLALEWMTGDSKWAVDIKLEDSGSGTRLTFEQALGEQNQAEYIGPGWEYYVDRLGFYMESEAFPEWDEYFPAMGEFYKQAQEKTSS